jgi:hypothetical protein
MVKYPIRPSIPILGVHNPTWLSVAVHH